MTGLRYADPGRRKYSPGRNLCLRGVCARLCLCVCVCSIERGTRFEGGANSVYISGIKRKPRAKCQQREDGSPLFIPPLLPRARFTETLNHEPAGPVLDKKIRKYFPISFECTSIGRFECFTEQNRCRQTTEDRGREGGGTGGGAGRKKGVLNSRQSRDC